MKTIPRPSSNFDARPKGGPIDILLMHYTGMRTAVAALARLCDPQARVSAHYTVDEDGTVYAHVDEKMRAFHAGVSYWAGTTDINARSIGIEVVNPGHEFGYREFPGGQIAAVIELARDIIARYGISAARVLGHSDVAPARKQDPGELFPWRRLAEAGVGLWPFRTDEALIGSFEEGLRRFGYGIAPDGPASLGQAAIAFQRHFRPECIDGVADGACERILAALLRSLD